MVRNSFFQIWGDNLPTGCMGGYRGRGDNGGVWGGW